MRRLPNALTLLRLLIALPLASALYCYDQPLVIAWLSLAIATDLLDGWLARRLRVCSSFGAYFDATADFALVMAALAVLTLRSVYPAWVLLLIGLMFVQFVLSSRHNQPLYDPIGKYYGAALYSMIFALVILPDLLLSYALLAGIVMLSVLSLSTRLFFWQRTVSAYAQNRSSGGQ